MACSQALLVHPAGHPQRLLEPLQLCSLLRHHVRQPGLARTLQGLSAAASTSSAASAASATSATSTASTTSSAALERRCAACQRWRRRRRQRQAAASRPLALAAVAASALAPRACRAQGHVGLVAKAERRRAARTVLVRRLAPRDALGGRRVVAVLRGAGSGVRAGRHRCARRGAGANKRTRRNKNIYTASLWAR